MVGAIKNDRLVCHRTIVGAMNKPRFIDFIRHVLCPRLPRGAVVVLDNLRAHHAPRCAKPSSAVGATVLYLPPYLTSTSIPSSFAGPSRRTWLRRLARRTETGLRKAINNTMLRVGTDQLRAWFGHCGFGQRK